MKTPDIKALAAICDFGGMIHIEGDGVPLLLPDGEPDQMDFDKAACAAGLKKFLRPMLPSDGPVATGNPGATHVIVEEMKPGARLRRPAKVMMNDRN